MSVLGCARGWGRARRCWGECVCKEGSARGYRGECARRGVQGGIGVSVQGDKSKGVSVSVQGGECEGVCRCEVSVHRCHRCACVHL